MAGLPIRLKDENPMNSYMRQEATGDTCTGVGTISKTKPKENVKNNTAFDLENIQIGDVVEIRWCDVHAYERIEISEIDEHDEPQATRCWGAVVRKGSRYLFIASEIGDRDSDGAWIEALPYRMIETCKVFNRISISEH